MPTPERIRRQFARELSSRKSGLDPLRAALLLAQAENPELSPERAEIILQGWAESFRARLDANEEPYQKILAFNRLFFQELGFTQAPNGSPGIEYIDPHRVLAGRSGWPVTLALLFGDLATRLRLPLRLMSFPGHLLFASPWLGQGNFVDPADGKLLCLDEARHRIDLHFSGQRVLLKPEQLLPLSDRRLLERYMVALQGVYLAEGQHTEALRVADWRLVLSPRSRKARRSRGLILYDLNRFEEAHRDLRPLLLRSAAGRVDPRLGIRARVCALLASLEKSVRSR